MQQSQRCLRVAANEGTSTPRAHLGKEGTQVRADEAAPAGAAHGLHAVRVALADGRGVLLAVALLLALLHGRRGCLLVRRGRVALLLLGRAIASATACARAGQ